MHLRERDGLLADKSDPTGLGMFSRIGRLANQRFAVYKERNAILFNKSKTKKISEFPDFKVSPLSTSLKFR